MKAFPYIRGFLRNYSALSAAAGSAASLHTPGMRGRRATGSDENDLRTYARNLGYRGIETTVALSLLAACGPIATADNAADKSALVDRDVSAGLSAECGAPVEGAAARDAYTGEFLTLEVARCHDDCGLFVLGLREPAAGDVVTFLEAAGEPEFLGFREYFHEDGRLHSFWARGLLTPNAGATCNPTLEIRGGFGLVDGHLEGEVTYTTRYCSDDFPDRACRDACEALESELRAERPGLTGSLQECSASWRVAAVQ